MRILVSYRGIPQSPGWATGDFVVKAFRALGHDAYPYAKYYQQNRWVEWRPALDNQDWDLILFMECNDGDPQYPELRLVRARKTACWLFDTSYHQDRYRKLVDYFGFDHVFLANPLTIQEYKVWGYKNVHYLPYAYDSELHYRPMSENRSHRLALVGSDREDRRQLVKDLAKIGVQLELISGVFREQYVDTLASAKYILNQNPVQGRGLLNMRHFEAQAAGAIIIEQDEDMDANREAGLFCNMPIYEPHNLTSVADAINIFDTIDHEILVRYNNSFLKRDSYQNRCNRILEVING